MTRFRRDFHGRETAEEARDRNAAEDFEESGGLEREGLARERAERPFLFTDSGSAPTHDPRSFGRSDLDNPSGDAA
jgi:hypothetical protein